MINRLVIIQTFNLATENSTFLPHNLYALVRNFKINRHLPTLQKPIVFLFEAHGVLQNVK